MGFSAPALIPARLETLENSLSCDIKSFMSLDGWNQAVQRQQAQKKQKSSGHFCPTRKLDSVSISSLGKGSSQFLFYCSYVPMHIHT